MLLHFCKYVDLAEIKEKEESRNYTREASEFVLFTYIGVITFKMDYLW
jgi:hypothetical protein